MKLINIDEICQSLTSKDVGNSKLNDRWEGVSDYGDPRGRGSEYRGENTHKSSVEK